MTEVSPAWLNHVVIARHRLDRTNMDLLRLAHQLRRGDMDATTYSEAAEEALMRDGVGHRYYALRSRYLRIADDLAAVESTGSTVGSTMLALTELQDTLNETLLNVEALLADTETAVEDPFIDRLEEHRAHERA